MIEICLVIMSLSKIVAPRVWTTLIPTPEKTTGAVGPWVGGKPGGCCQQRGSSSFVGYIGKGPRGNRKMFTKIFSCSKFPSEQDAKNACMEWLREQSLILNMTKNQYRWVGSETSPIYYEMQLQKGYTMLFSPCHLDVACNPNYIWNLQYGYAVTKDTKTGKTIKFHLLVTNPKKGFEIDHINRVRSDNRVENLREVTDTEQSKNHSKSRNNTSGYTGVYFREKRKKSGEAFVATWRENGKSCSKNFATSTYGSKDKAFKAAVKWRKEVAKKLENTNGLKRGFDGNIIEENSLSSSSDTELIDNAPTAPKRRKVEEEEEEEESSEIYVQMK